MIATLPPEAGRRAPASLSGPYPMGLLALLATVGMLFAAFTAALMVRRTGGDWVPIALPRTVILSTTAIILSSLALERGRVWIVRGAHATALQWLGAAGLLGMLFLTGQLVTWHRLVEAGVFLPSSPYAAFFYMLSVTHAVHVAGGLGALGWTFRRLRQGAYTPARHAGFTHAAIYWHFVGVVWVYLLILLTAY